MADVTDATRGQFLGHVGENQDETSIFSAISLLSNPQGYAQSTTRSNI